MSYKDIRSHIEEIYAVNAPESTISAVTDHLGSFEFCIGKRYRIFSINFLAWCYYDMLLS